MQANRLPATKKPKSPFSGCTSLAVYISGADIFSERRLVLDISRTSNRRRSCSPLSKFKMANQPDDMVLSKEEIANELFERLQVEKLKVNVILPSSEESEPAKETFTNGFNFRFEAEQIISIKKINGILFCLMKWKNIEEPSYVKQSIVKMRCPNLMIDFFERNLAVVD